MGIRDKPTAPASPWQNGFAERLIGSIQRECVDHIIVLGESICAESCDPTLAITTTFEHIGHWIKMRQSLARFSEPESSPQIRSWADFVVTTSEFKFSVHTTRNKHLNLITHAHPSPKECLRDFGDPPKSRRFSRLASRVRLGRPSHIADPSSNCL